jgi:hypothetical protein
MQGIKSLTDSVRFTLKSATRGTLADIVIGWRIRVKQKELKVDNPFAILFYSVCGRRAAENAYSKVDLIMVPTPQAA